MTIQNYSYIQEHISIYFINFDRFQNQPHYGGHLSGHFEFLKILNDAAQHHLDYLTLQHHPTTKLSIKTCIQNINYRNIDHFQKKKRILAAILAAIL